MSPKADFDWQILMDATIVPPAERFPWSELRRADDRTSLGQIRQPSLDSRREPRPDQRATLSSRSGVAASAPTRSGG